MNNAWEQAKVTGQSVYNWGISKSKEAANIARNWTKSLEETIRHVCDLKATKAKDTGASPKPVSFGGGGVASWDSTAGTSSRYQSNASVKSKAKKGSSKRTSGSHYAVNPGGAASWDSPAGPSSRYQPKVTAKSKVLTEEELAARRAEGVRLLKTLGGELSGWYNAKRIWTGKDPVTGEEANRWWATGELVFDIATTVLPVAKLGKLAKAGKVVDTVDDISDASKALKTIDRIDDTKDSLKVAEVVDTVDDVSDVSKGYKAPKGGGGITTTIIKGDKKITFGHGARHFEDIPNLDISDVENAIAQHVSENIPKIGESPRVTISVNGHIIEYRPYNLGDGRINIGTYIPKDK